MLRYDCIKYTDVLELEQVTEIAVPWGSETVRTIVWSGVVEGLPVYFLEPHSKHKFFWRGAFYGQVCRFKECHPYTSIVLRSWYFTQHMFAS